MKLLAYITALALLGLVQAAPPQKMKKASTKAATSKSKPPAVITTCKKSGTYALTFDDGPYEYEDQLNKLLISNGAVGTCKPCPSPLTVQRRGH